jgi:hypothetical protein
MALLTVKGAVDDITRVGQRGGELAVEVGVVFNDKKPQGMLRFAGGACRAPTLPFRGTEVSR